MSGSIPPLHYNERKPFLKKMSDLYEQDFNLWVEETKKAIQNRDFENMDWDNLLDEIDDMGASHKRALESYLQRLVEHILKLRYWESEYDRNYRHWRAEVNNFRNRIKRILKKNPSLKNYLAEEYTGIFDDAVQNMSFEFDIADGCFIPIEKILEKDYFG
jgi:hypothetical protein